MYSSMFRGIVHLISLAMTDYDYDDDADQVVCCDQEDSLSSVIVQINMRTEWIKLFLQLE